MSVMLTYLQDPEIILVSDAVDAGPAATVSRRLGRPVAFQRTPPRSQIDRSVPQAGQRAIQARDSASTEVAQDRGAMDVIRF